MSYYGTSPRTVSNQPSIHREVEQAFSGDRRPIPISTIDWQSTQASQVIPLNGVEFLRDVQQLVIQQTVEVSELMSRVPSENRYLVKVPRGETLYYCVEASQDCERTCFGSSRAFVLRLYDPTHQEALQLTRRLACGACCSLFCYLQEMEVWIPPGDLLGTVKQNFSITSPHFSIVNRHGDVLYRIEGPDSVFGCFLGKEHNFQIHSADGANQIGTVIHQWDAEQVDYNVALNIQIDIREVEHKALLLAAAFLLDYMYFESSKKRSLCKCCL